MFIDRTRIWSLWKSNQRFLSSGAKPCVSLPRLPVASVWQSSIGLSPKCLQSDLDSRWTPTLACIWGIFRPPPGVVGSRSFPTLRWNTDFPGYKNSLDFGSWKTIWYCSVRLPTVVWGRIVVFLTIRMFFGKISAGEKSTNRPSIRSLSPTKVLKSHSGWAPKNGRSTTVTFYYFRWPQTSDARTLTFCRKTCESIETDTKKIISILNK